MDATRDDSRAGLRKASSLRGLALVWFAVSGCATPAPPATGFVEVRESGLDLVNVSGAAEKDTVVGSLGQGVAVLDYDRDGKLDVFLPQGGRFDATGIRAEASRLYRNLGGLRFRDVTAEAGLDVRGWAHGAWRVDFDSDGWPDLYVTVFGGANRFLRNREGTFVDVTAAWGGGDPGPSTAAVFFDADGDRDLDLWVGNYVALDPEDPSARGRACEWHGLRVFCGPVGTTPAPDTFWRNRGGRLTLDERTGLSRVAPSYALGAVASDLDLDGDLDLYVANDSRPNYLFENRGGDLVETALLAGVDRNRDGKAQAGMGVVAADFDGDGREDLFVTNFSHDSNTLYRNVSDERGMRFADVTYEADLGLVSVPFLSWGVSALDADRDGRLDIAIASGHVYPQVEGVASGTSYAQPNQLFRNRGADERGRVRFEAVTDPGLSVAGVSRGLAAADLDDDGAVDLLLTEIAGRPRLLRNRWAGAGGWIGLELVGAPPNRDAIGARVVLASEDGTRRHAVRGAGGGYLSSPDPRLHFGIGASTGALRVTVAWPGGERESFGPLAPGRYHSLAQGEGEPAR